MKSMLLRGLSGLAYVVRLAVLLFALLLTIDFAFGYLDSPEKYSLVMQLSAVKDKLGEPLIFLIQKNIPHKYHGVDFSLLILLIMMIFLAYLCDILIHKLKQMRDREDYYNWKKRVGKTISKDDLSLIDAKFKALDNDKEGALKSSDRKKLLQEFVMLKHKLDGMGQQLAFLAIDVVDSTGMKKGEDKHLVSYDFENYNEIVLNCLKKNGVVKYAMTPDGIMSCFRTVDDAVGAATDLLDRLKQFNQQEKKIKRAFAIRAGINAGFIYLDDDTPLEQVSDRAIDIAGHMQKNAKPDTINIAASAIEPLKNRGGFKETVDVIDDQRVYQWPAN